MDATTAPDTIEIPSDLRLAPRGGRKFDDVYELVGCVDNGDLVRITFTNNESMLAKVIDTSRPWFISTITGMSCTLALADGRELLIDLEGTGEGVRASSVNSKLILHARHAYASEVVDWERALRSHTGSGFGLAKLSK